MIDFQQQADIRPRTGGHVMTAPRGPQQGRQRIANARDTANPDTGDALQPPIVGRCLERLQGVDVQCLVYLLRHFRTDDDPHSKFLC